VARHDRSLGGSPGLSNPGRLADWARRIQAYYFLDSVALRAPSRAKVDDLGPHGENLAAFLARLKGRHKDFARLIERVRAHYPWLVDLHLRRTKVISGGFARIFSHMPLSRVLRAGHRKTAQLARDAGADRRGSGREREVTPYKASRDSRWEPNTEQNR
jgi:hypothetical protein